MEWYYPKDGEWVPVQLHEPKDGEWVPIGGGGDGGGGKPASPSGWVNPKYLPTGSPPTRSKTVYESDYSGLQSALNSIGPDTRLVLDGGTYSGNYEIPRIDHITIDGNGSRISRSNVGGNAIEYNQTGKEYSRYTKPVGTYKAGQTSIDVTDASIFSVGDEICIRDLSQVHPDQPKTTSGMDRGQGMFTAVTAVDTANDVLTLDEPLVNNFRNPNGDLMIAPVNWGAEDVRLTNITLDGNSSKNGGGGIVMPIRRLKGLWFDNVTVREGLEGLWCYESYQIRVHNSTFKNLGGTRGQGARYNGYPCTFQAGTTHVYVTDSESTDSGRYGFQSGSGVGSGRWWPTRNGRIEDCHTENCYQRGYDQHPGSYHWEYINCTARNDGFNRARSDGCYAQGGGVKNPGQAIWYDRQAGTPARLDVIEHHYINPSSDVYKLLDKYGGTRKERVRFVDVWIEDAGSMDDVWEFRADDNVKSTIGNFIVENVAVDDTWITSSNIGSFLNISEDNSAASMTIESQSVTAPEDGRTPSQYFAAEYGWTSGQLV